MTDAHESEQGGGQAPGAATAGTGTPVPVDVSGSARGRAALALFVAGPVIWTLHFVVVYLIAEAGCTGDGPGLRLLDPPVPVVATLVATAVAALACLATAGVAWRRWQALRAAPAEDGWLPDHGAALCLMGGLLALLGVVEVVFVGLPAVALGPC